jgi:hypothetical protein
MNIFTCIGDLGGANGEEKCIIAFDENRNSTFVEDQQLRTSGRANGRL